MQVFRYLHSDFIKLNCQTPGYIKYVGREDRVYKVTEKGYIMSDNFKTDNKLDVCMNSSQILEMFK